MHPNFFIVGAPKCGTTSLYSYLKDHPNIFMPRKKEPHFFASDLNVSGATTTLDDYLELFAEASADQHIAVGESSVHYMFSEVALQNVYKFNQDARIIAMFRHPVDMIYSYYSQMLWNALEHIPEFERAWFLQEDRKQGQYIHKLCYDPPLLQYKSVASFGTQVEKLLQIFPREQVHFVFLEDMKTSAKDVYEGILRFLDVPSDDRTAFPVYNENKIARSNLLNRILRTPSFYKPIRSHRIPRFLYHRLIAWNKRIDKRDPLSTSFRKYLTQEFKPEILKLEKLTNRSLRHWID